MKHRSVRIPRLGHSLFVAAVAFASLAIWFQSATVHAAFPGTNGKIAFTSVRNGNEEIYVMNADGTGQTNLTNHPASDGYASWSPNGARILFISNRGGDNDVYVMNADGSGVTNLTNDGGIDAAASWSPDGGRIVFGSNRSGNFEIYVMNADGSGVTALTNDPASDFSPTFSPDGTRIAFWSQRDPGNGEWNIYVMNAVGSAVSGDLFPNGVQDYEPKWSPDGTSLTFWSGVGNEHDVYVMNPDGSGVTNITSSPGDDGHPDYSPDGTQIVFFSTRNGPKNEICLMASTGGPVGCITSQAEGPSYSPSWQPAAPSVTSVNIDIKPGGSPNNINPSSRGLIRVAILSAADFDATALDVSTVRFGPNSAVVAHGQVHIRDVNRDGRLDMEVRFRIPDTGIACGDTSANLYGSTVGGEPIQGSDSVRTVGCH